MLEACLSLGLRVKAHVASKLKRKVLQDLIFPSGQSLITIVGLMRNRCAWAFHAHTYNCTIEKLGLANAF